MGLWNWIVTQTTGVDPSAEQARSDAADAATLALDQQDLSSGVWTQAQYDQAVGDIQTGNASTGAGDVSGSIAGQALVGATEIFTDPAQWWADTKAGATIVAQAAAQAAGRLMPNINDMMKGYFQAFLKTIPWYIWVGLSLGFLLLLYILYRKLFT